MNFYSFCLKNTFSLAFPTGLFSWLFCLCLLLSLSFLPGVVKTCADEYSFKGSAFPFKTLLVVWLFPSIAI